MSFSPIDLSKEISYALRHAPQDYGLTLDEQGWVNVEDLIAALKRKKEYCFLTIKDIADMIQFSEKKRHEIKDNRIRAMYGHSVEEKIVKEAAQPPDVLYHGTAHMFLEKILEQGLISKDRQYVHLSQDQQMAIDVGLRRDAHPVILRIDAVTAWREGIKFCHGNDTVWLADSIPVKYITINSEATD